VLIYEPLKENKLDYVSEHIITSVIIKITLDQASTSKRLLESVFKNTTLDLLIKTNPRQFYPCFLPTSTSNCQSNAYVSSTFPAYDCNATSIA